MIEGTIQSLPVLYRAGEIASILKISRSLAYRLIQQGTIPSVRINHSVRVRQNDLEEYLQKNWSGWMSQSTPESDKG